jgi:ketosteroid isomerase-like protein
MPQNVETVLAAYEHLNHGDIEALIGLCAADFQMDMTERVFNPDMYQGAQDLHRFYKGVQDAWDTYLWTVQDTHAVDDAVVAMVHCRGKGHGGGPSAEWQVAWLWQLANGQLVSVRFYRDPPRALEAVGLAA